MQSFIRTTIRSTSDVRELKSFQFIPNGRGNFGRVSDGEEGMFYLLFTYCSQSKDGYESSMPAYFQFVVQYREKS